MGVENWTPVAVGGWSAALSVAVFALLRDARWVCSGRPRPVCGAWSLEASLAVESTVVVRWAYPTARIRSASGDVPLGQREGR
jgi:hypothetical protein